MSSLAPQGVGVMVDGGTSDPGYSIRAALPCPAPSAFVLPCACVPLRLLLSAFLCLCLCPGRCDSPCRSSGF
eukprot:5260292-Pyramimonas_sp.AAC.1